MILLLQKVGEMSNSTIANASISYVEAQCLKRRFPRADDVFEVGDISCYVDGVPLGRSIFDPFRGEHLFSCIHTGDRRLVRDTLALIVATDKSLMLEERVQQGFLHRLWSQEETIAEICTTWWDTDKVISVCAGIVFGLGALVVCMFVNVMMNNLWLATLSESELRAFIAALQQTLPEPPAVVEPDEVPGLVIAGGLVCLFLGVAIIVRDSYSHRSK